jgi:hypothetical protein
MLIWEYGKLLLQILSPILYPLLRTAKMGLSQVTGQPEIIAGKKSILGGCESRRLDHQGSVVRSYSDLEERADCLNICKQEKIS